MDTIEKVNDAIIAAVKANNLDDRIKKVAKHYNSKAKSDELHVLLCAAVEHAVIHKDASKVTLLYNSLSAVANKPYMGKWLRTYTTLEHRKNSKGVEMWLGKDKEYHWLNRDAAIAMRFWNMKGAGKPAQDWSLAKMMDFLLTKAETRAEKQKLSQPDMELLATISKMKLGEKVKAYLPTETAH